MQLRRDIEVAAIPLAPSILVAGDYVSGDCELLC